MFGQTKGFVYNLDLLIASVIVISLITYSAHNIYQPEQSLANKDMTMSLASSFMNGNVVNDSVTGLDWYVCSTIQTHNNDLNSKICIGGNK